MQSWWGRTQVSEARPGAPGVVVVLKRTAELRSIPHPFDGAERMGHLGRGWSDKGLVEEGLPVFEQEDVPEDGGGEEEGVNAV